MTSGLYWGCSEFLPLQTAVAPSVRLAQTVTLSSAITVCFEILPCVFSCTVFRCFRYPYFHCPCVNLGLARRRQLPRCRFWATEKSLKNLSTKIWGSQNGPHMGIWWLLHHWADHIVGLSMSSQACKEKNASSQWKWVTLNCFNDKCLRKFTIGSVRTAWPSLSCPTMSYYFEGQLHPAHKSEE